MTILRSRKIAVVVALVAALPAFANEACKIDVNDPSSLAPCYQRELDEKTKSNDVYTRLLADKAKTKGRLKKGRRVQPESMPYADLINRLNDVVAESRKIALNSCVRMTGRFMDKELAASAIANCRTEAEFELEKKLKRFESKINFLPKLTTKN